MVSIVKRKAFLASQAKAAVQPEQVQDTQAVYLQRRLAESQTRLADMTRAYYRLDADAKAGSVVVRSQAVALKEERWLKRMYMLATFLGLAADLLHRYVHHWSV